MKSKTCRNAVEFGDKLDNEFIKDLSAALGKCSPRTDPESKFKKCQRKYELKQSYN